MADFGPAEFIFSERRNKNMLKVRSRLDDEHPNHFYVFRYKDAPGLCMRYKCVQCEKLKKQAGGIGSIRCVSVKDGVIQHDPQINHNPECHPLPLEEIVGVQVERQMTREVRSGVRHMEAHRKGLQTLGKRCRDEEADYGAVCYPSDWRNLPEEYRVSLRGRNDEFGVEQHRGEQWLRLIHENPDIILLMTDKEMEVMFRATSAMGDGTFDKRPKEFTSGQIYTLHADVNGESVPIGTAIMKEKTIEAYTLLFRTIRNRIEALHPGEPLHLETFHMDFEHASIVAAEAVFGVPVKGCLFHFSQCIDRRVKEFHLQQEYAAGADIYHWIRNLVALSMVPRLPPDDYVQTMFENYMDVFPETLVPPYNIRCRQLANYFRDQWMNGRETIARWNHYDNMGDRTTNKAEGWHNKLNEVIGRSHMKLDRFLDALQQEHNAQLIRIDQLENGQAPKPQNPIYAQLNVRINRYRDDLREWLEVNRNAANRDKEAYIMGYMRRMQYLLAGQTPPQAD